MRAQVAQLQAQNQKLVQQAQSTLTAAQRQQEQLQQLQQERAAVQQVAIENERNQCISNLRQIDAAKQQWALEFSKTTDAIPTEQDITPYLKGNVMPTCPSGGTYVIGAMGNSPTCSIPGHVLAQ